MGVPASASVIKRIINNQALTPVFGQSRNFLLKIIAMLICKARLLYEGFPRNRYNTLLEYLSSLFEVPPLAMNLSIDVVVIRDIRNCSIIDTG